MMGDIRLHILPLPIVPRPKGGVKGDKPIYSNKTAVAAKVGEKMDTNSERTSVELTTPPLHPTSYYLHESLTLTRLAGGGTRRATLTRLAGGGCYNFFTIPTTRLGSLSSFLSATYLHQQQHCPVV